MVHPNRVGTKLFHEIGVKLALCSVCERIVFDELVGHTCEEDMRLANVEAVGGLKPHL